MSIKEIEEEIISEFEIFGEDWEGKYEHLIDLGKSMPMIDEKNRTEENLLMQVMQLNADLVSALQKQKANSIKTNMSLQHQQQHHEVGVSQDISAKIPSNKDLLSQLGHLREFALLCFSFFNE